MEIIKHGDPERIDRKYIIKLECKECGCVFKIDRRKDKYYENQIDGAWIECPDCKYPVSF